MPTMTASGYRPEELVLQPRCCFGCGTVEEMPDAMTDARGKHVKHEIGSIHALGMAMSRHLQKPDHRHAVGCNHSGCGVYAAVTLRLASSP